MKTCAAYKCNYPVFSNLYCKAHQYMRKDSKYDRRSAIQKYYDNLKKEGCVNESGGLIVSKTKEVVDKRELAKWYLCRRKECTGTCINCGYPSSKNSEKYWKWSCCHILPKEHFDSIKINPHNFIELCITCHTLYDRNFETASKMKCWEVAVEKFLIFEPQIKENHKLLSVFKSYIPTELEFKQTEK